MAELRMLIDFATGENWEMPAHLYEDYLSICNELTTRLPNGMTCIQYWLSTLSDDDRLLVRKKI